MLESVIPMVLLFVTYYIGIGIFLYLPLHYTRGIPDSFGVRKRYSTILLFTVFLVSSLAVPVWLNSF